MREGAELAGHLRLFRGGRRRSGAGRIEEDEDEDKDGDGDKGESCEDPLGFLLPKPLGLIYGCPDFQRFSDGMF